MKTFQLEYKMDITLNEEIHNHHFSFRCLPRKEPRQISWKNQVLLQADYFAYSYDCFNNHFIYGYIEHPHKELNFFLRSQVCVDSHQHEWDDRLTPVFRLPTPQTKVKGIAFNDFLTSCTRKCEALPNAYEKGLYVMHAVHDYMTYVKGVTEITTTASQAFEAGRGVCQDYSQIMLAILRAMHIPARYVAGVLSGEPLSHAWVDVFHDGCWWGLDPTNDKVVDDDYIVLSVGRDYADCLVNQGIFFSPVRTKQIQDITVSVVPQ